MSTYSFETLNGELSFPLLYVIANKLQLFPYPEGTFETNLYTFWGDYYNKFNGLVANLLFDFGYLGTIFFAFSYFFLLRLFKPVRGKMSFNSLLVLGVFFILPAMGIFNYHMRLVVYNALIVYSIIVYMCAFFFKKIMKKAFWGNLFTN